MKNPEKTKPPRIQYAKTKGRKTQINNYPEKQKNDQRKEKLTRMEAQGNSCSFP